jgi:hypothetical protein
VPDWLSEQLRLTVFPIQDAREPDPNWWHRVVGETAETKTVQKGVAIREGGSIRGGYCTLSLEIQASRVDWLMTAVVKPGEPISGFLTFDKLSGALKTFRELFEPWLKECLAIRRIAVGSVLILPVEDRKDGYEKIAKYLPYVKLDAEHSRDFNYLINRPRSSKSGLENFTINRLSRWSVARFTGIQLQGEIPGNLQLTETSGDWSACRVELDINTQTERKDQLPSERVLRLFDELITLTEEIAEKGDVP